MMRTVVGVVMLALVALVPNSLVVAQPERPEVNGPDGRGAVSTPRESCRPTILAASADISARDDCCGNAGSCGCNRGNVRCCNGKVTSCPCHSDGRSSSASPPSD